MPNEKITKRAVDLASPAGKPYFLWDTELRGFGLKITPAGGKIYVLQYRNGGRETRTQRFTIGSHGSPWTPLSARQEATRLLTLVRQGSDPRAHARNRKIAATTLAFEDYVEFFTKRYLMIVWKDSWREAYRILKRDVVPIFRSRPLPEITKADVQAVLSGMDDRPASKRITYSVLNKLFNWAHQERDDISASPMSSIKAPSTVRGRDRHLTAEELASFLLATTEFSYPFGPLFRLLVSTLQRRENVASVDWLSLDLPQALWLQTEEVTKNDLSNFAALNTMALHVIDTLGEKNAGLLFTTTGKTPVSGFSKAKLALDEVMVRILRERAAARGEDLSDLTDKQVLPPWRLHDLRRTGASKLQAMGVPIEVTEEVLGHKSGTREGVAGVYNKYRYLAEKQAALAIWGEYLRELERSSLANEPRKKLIYNERLLQMTAESS